ncbi:hypothetical protein [Acaryochloris sp. IP29b_bin.137]|uniref:hypothetical protein n=1 Tax=Acaryochloris sp. IP29b_bin.137 TaxID=2969217 RepID=UPI00261AB0DF|nr:hypothetical protein [Acaryochloris sp. IP29b_bin.137]
MSFDRSQWVAVLTGAIALALGIGYLLLVQLLDARGDMLPAPMSTLKFSGSLLWVAHLMTSRSVL